MHPPDDGCLRVRPQFTPEEIVDLTLLGLVYQRVEPALDRLSRPA